MSWDPTQFNREIKDLFKEAFVELVKELQTERYLRVEEVSKLTGISERQIHVMAKEGDMPKARVPSGGLRRWLYTELIDWMRTRPTSLEDLTAEKERRNHVR